MLNLLTAKFKFFLLIFEHTKNSMNNFYEKKCEWNTYTALVTTLRGVLATSCNSPGDAVKGVKVKGVKYRAGMRMDTFYFKMVDN